MILPFDDTFVQKITYSAGDSNELIRHFRNDKDFRIAVTVTLVATGTARLKDPNIGQGLLVPVVIHLQLYLEVADVGTRGGTDELPGFQIRKILSLIDVLFLGRYGHAPVLLSRILPWCG